jgi:hypothetical protein
LDWLNSDTLNTNNFLFKKVKVKASTAPTTAKEVITKATSPDGDGSAALITEGHQEIAPTGKNCS